MKEIEYRGAYGCPYYATHRMADGRWERLNGKSRLQFLPHGQGHGAYGGFANVLPEPFDKMPLRIGGLDIGGSIESGALIRVERNGDMTVVSMTYSPNGPSATVYLASGSLAEVMADAMAKTRVWLRARKSAGYDDVMRLTSEHEARVAAILAAGTPAYWSPEEVAVAEVVS